MSEGADQDQFARQQNTDGSYWRVCCGCYRNFSLPKKDPEREMCAECLKQKGLPRIERRLEESQPHVPVRVDDHPTPPATEYLQVLEVDERPAPDEHTAVPLWKRLSKRDALEYAAELAADMETGYYVPHGAEKPWEPRRFVIREILRVMGYSKTYVDKSMRPAWYPDGGTQAFRGYVEWKVRERQMLGRIAHERLVPYVEAVTFKGFAEVARRLSMEPEKIPFRDLATFTLRGAEVIKESADPFSGRLTEAGASAYEKMAKAIEAVGDDTARKQLAAMLQGELDNARAQVRQVITIPAKAAS